MYQMFSPNMLKTYELCPKKFSFKYIKNIQMPVEDGIFEFGKNIHALASYYLKNENITNLETSLSKKEREVWEYLKKVKYFGYEVINTEYNLSFKLGNYFFGGRLDALVKNGDRYYILDYKTGSVPENTKYDFQTMIYLLAVKNFFNTDNIVFVYIDLKNKGEVNVIYTPELGAEYMQKLLAVAGKIDAEEEFKKRSDCKCEYSLICY